MEFDRMNNTRTQRRPKNEWLTNVEWIQRQVEKYGGEKHKMMQKNETKIQRPEQTDEK